MATKKRNSVTKENKARNAGVSLHPQLIEDATKLAKSKGFPSLSAFTRFLLIRKLQPKGMA